MKLAAEVELVIPQTAALFLALIVPTVAGCVILPLPPLGAQRGVEEIESLQVGVSTRQDVHQALGSPDLAVGDRHEIFELSEEDLNLLVVPVLLPVAGFGPVGEELHRVLAEYGPGDVLRSLHWEALVEGRAASSDAPRAWQESGDSAPAESAQKVLNWEVPESWSSSVAVAPFGDSFAISHGVGNAVARARSLTQVRDGQTGELLQEIEYGPLDCPMLVPPSDRFLEVADPTAFLSDGVHLASVARDGIVCVWNLEAQRGVLTVDAGEDEARRLASARAAPILASADANGLVKVWDGISGGEITSVTPCSIEPGCDHDGWSLALALSDDGGLLATSQYGGRGYLGTDFRGAVRLWDTTTGVELARITLPGEGPMLVGQKLALASDQSRLAIHLGDHVQIWRLGEPGPGQLPGRSIRRSPIAVELEQVLLLPFEDPDAYRERSLGFSGDGTRLAAGNGSAVVWETDSWRQIWRMVSPSSYSEFGWEFGQGFAFTADGEAVVTVRSVWQLPEPKEARYGSGSKSNESEQAGVEG